MRGFMTKAELFARLGLKVDNYSRCKYQNGGRLYSTFNHAPLPPELRIRSHGQENTIYRTCDIKKWAKEYDVPIDLSDHPPLPQEQVRIEIESLSEIKARGASSWIDNY